MAPSWESLMAVARPIPEPAPVQMMTLLSNCLVILTDDYFERTCKNPKISII